MTETELLQIPLADIRAGDNDRKLFDEEELFQLSSSIAAIGLIEPILVRPDPDPDGPTPWVIVGGERRWRAHHLPPCKRKGLDTIACTVRRDLTEKMASALMLAENTGRTNLNSMEEARGYARQRAHGVSTERIARQAGVAHFRVKWRLALLELIPEAQGAIEDGRLDAGPARELGKLSPSLQLVALKGWVANPAMGHFMFRKLTDKLLADAKAPVQTGMFAPEDSFMQAAVKAKAQTFSISALRKMIGQLTTQLEASGYEGPLLDKAREMS